MARSAEDVGVLRIGHQHLDRGVAFGHRADVELLHELAAEHDAFGRQLRHVLDADQRQIEHLGDGLGVVALGHQAQPRQQCQQAAAGLVLQPARATEIGVLEAAFRQQRVDDARFCARVCPCVPGVVDDCVHGCPGPLAGPPLGMSADSTSSLPLQVPGDDADSKLYSTRPERVFTAVDRLVKLSITALFAQRGRAHPPAVLPIRQKPLAPCSRRAKVASRTGG